MNGIRRALLWLTVTAVLIFLGGSGAFAGLPGDLPKAIAMEKIQVPFIENRGQAPEGVAYYAQTFGGLFYVTGKGAMVLLIPGKEDPALGAILTERLEGTARIRPEGLQRAETIVNVYSVSIPGPTSPRYGSRSRVQLSSQPEKRAI
ncbi:MAG: hypothetical protein RRA15_08935 [bacterium]|nr:hypothetical protein [bacterium]MDT8366607.1 hypothetical protein [bacterium]